MISQKSIQTKRRPRRAMINVILAASTAICGGLSEQNGQAQDKAPIDARQPQNHRYASSRRPQRLPPVIRSSQTNSDAKVAATPIRQDATIPVGYNAPDAAKPAQPRSTAPQRWLRSSTATSNAEVSRRLLAQASRDYSVGAWLSAETTAWESLRWAAEGVDLADRERGAKSADRNTAKTSLQIARDAIREARDFSGVYGVVDSIGIQRMARSHVTDLLDQTDTAGISATDASDLYLDHARLTLAPLAERSVEAAQGLDLLAAIYLSRADAQTLPSATALCLRRAALQGQPGNASLASRLGMHLADVGLLDEARWALEHSLSIETDATTSAALVRVLRRGGASDEAANLIAKIHDRKMAGAIQPSSVGKPRVPQVTELAPADFAALSQSVIPMKKSDTAPAVNPSVLTPASLASARVNATVTDAGNGTDSQDGSVVDPILSPESKPGMIRRFMSSFKRVW